MTLREVLEAFAERARKVKSTEELIALCKKQKQVLHDMPITYKTRLLYMSLSLKKVRELFDENRYRSCLPHLVPTKEECKEITRWEQERVKGTLTSRVGIDVDTYLRAIQELKGSHRWQELAACLALATGRRVTEILKTMHIAPIAHKRHQVMFEGCLKNKGTRGPFPIPIVGLTPKEATSVLARLRKLKDLSQTPIAAVSPYSYHVNKILKSYLGEKAVGELVRGAYVSISYRMYSPPTVSEAVFGSQILGHARHDLNTVTTHYSRCYLK
jgi:hypothetical protein